MCCKYQELEEYGGIKVGQIVVFSFGNRGSFSETEVKIRNIYKNKYGRVNFLFKTPLEFHKWWKEKCGYIYPQTMSTAISELRVIN